MSNYDGFVQVNKLTGDEEQQEIKRFDDLKVALTKTKM